MYNSKDMNVSKTIKVFAVTVLFIAMKLPAALAGDYTILAFGDSLTAGYGLAPDQGFTAQLEQALRQQGHDITVINGGVSGDTSSGGLSRLQWVLSSIKTGKPDLVIVELGANDALRGIAPDITRANMENILAILAQQKIKTLVAGMLAPPNMGAGYGEKFNRIFPDLSLKYKDDLYPFFLDGVAGDASLNQSDAMHPNAKGVSVIVKKITPYVLDSLKIH